MSNFQKKNIVSKNASLNKAVNQKPIATPEKKAFSFYMNSFKWQLIIITLFVFVLYANTLGGEYVLDDGLMIKENIYTLNGFSGIKDILFHDSFAGLTGGNETGLYSGSRYRPLSQIVFAVVYAIFGLNPFIGHVINILAYALIGAVLLLVLRKIFVQVKQNADWYNLPLIITLLYLAHPIHTEVVANIKSLDEILCMLLSLMALWFSLKYVEDRKRINLFLIGICFLSGILAKENAVTFLAIIPLTLFFIYENWKKSILPIGLSLGAGLIAYFGFRFAALGFGVESVESKLLFHNPFLLASTSEKYATIMLTWLKYIQLLVFPHPLTHDYYPKQIPIVNWLDYRVIISLLLYLSLGVFALLKLLKKNRFSFAILFFLITFSVTSNLLFNLGLFMNERFMFMPSLGFSMALGFGLFKLIEKYKTYAKQISFGLILLLLAYSGKTISRNNAWLTGYGLFETDVKTSTESGRCNVIMGALLLNKTYKDSTNSKPVLEEAKYYLERGLKIYDGNTQGWRSLAEVNIKLNLLKEGRDCYLKAFTQEPADINSLRNMFYIANEYFKQYNYIESRKTLEIIFAKKPESEEPRILLAEIFMANKQVDSAKNMLESFVAKYPKSPKSFNKLGEYYGKYYGNIDKAIYYLEKSINIDPNYAAALENIGIAYGFKKQFDRAIPYLEKAVALNPNNVSLLTNIALTYKSVNNIQKANEYIARINMLTGKSQ